MISGVYWQLFGSHGSPNLKKLADEISLKMSNYQNDYVLNKALFSKIDKVYNDRVGANLDKHQLKLTEEVYIYFK